MSNANTISETSALLDLLVRSIVADKEAVTVKAMPGPTQTTVFQVRVGPKDKGKLIGKQGRTARSLRILLSAIGNENGAKFSLDIEGNWPNMRTREPLLCSGDGESTD